MSITQGLSLKKPNRQPVHLEYIGGKSPRQRIWELIRSYRHPWTLAELHDRLPDRIHYDTARTYLKALVAAGYVSRDCVGIASSKNPPLYQLARDAGVEAPKLKNDGRPVTMGRAQENVWRTLRALNRPFTLHELAALAETEEYPVTLGAVQVYLQHLKAAGYLKTDPDSGYYRLALNTGPRPPMVQRVHRVYDPNLHQVMWTETTGADDE
jgi:hypothetical protein